MAKARANCTCAACGKTFEFSAYKRNSREARLFEEWATEHITECRDCAEKRRNEKREAQNAEAAKEAENNGWPKLIGSEKQVAWATTLRQRQINELSEKINPELSEVFVECVDALVADKTVAAWWIDNTGYYVRSIIDEMMRERMNNPERWMSRRKEKAAEKEARSDSATIAQPESQNHSGIVDIKVAENRVSAIYRKSDQFMTIVKSLGYRWHGASTSWYMDIGVKTGTAKERAAELGNKLLNAGFAIRIQDSEVLQNAISGNYEPMTHRWISERNNCFFVTWAYNESFYDRARKLPGAKYVSPGIIVPDREYDSILDFAKTYGFRLTNEALELIDRVSASSRVVVPSEAIKPEYDEHPLEDVLKSSREILDDLKD